MQGVWLLVGLGIGGFVGAFAMLRFERARRDGVENAEIATLRAKLEASEATTQTFATAREEILAFVKQGAGEEIAQRGGEVVKQVTLHLEAALKQAGADDEERKRAVAGLVEPVNQKLAQLQQGLAKFDIDRERTSTDLTAKLMTVAAGQEAVARSATSLERALRQPQVRGRWGELGLRRLAEKAGMSDLCDFVEQVHVNDDGHILRPDMLVTLPGGRMIVVDSKVPLAPFLDAMQAEDEAQRVKAIQVYARGVRAHVRRLAAKDYAAQFPCAPDFVVMYLPGEHFLGSALEADPDLLEDAFAQRVHLATPATLLTLLRTAAYGFQEEKMAADAQAIADLGREVYDRITVLLGHIDKVSRCVNSLVKAQDDVVGSVDRRVLPSVRKFADFGVVGSEEQLPEPRRVDATARLIQAPELPPGAAIHELPSQATEEAA
jgi:DNA recombination protein RmuC